MKKIRRIVGAACLTLSIMLSGCSAGNSQPKQPIKVDYSPEKQEGCITPPFWVVEDSSTNAQIFLLGSMHAGESGAEYPDYILDAFSNSSWVAPEMDTKAFYKDYSLQKKCVDYIRLDGSTAEQIIGDAYNDTADFFSSHGILYQGMDSMMPFYWASAASSLVLKEAGLDTAYGTETLLLELAYSSRKEIREIEGGEAQYKMMGDIPMSVQLETLAQCVGDENISAQAEETLRLYEAWSSFDGDYLSELSVYDPDEVGNADDWQEYYDLMYTTRQQLMADFISDSLDSGELGFVFVGAMHFYAEPSIITLLEADGYTVHEICPE